MAFKIISSIDTNKGRGINRYVNIREFYINKRNEAQFGINLYKSKSTRDNDEKDKSISDSIPKKIIVKLTEAEVTQMDIKKLGYKYLKLDLEAKGIALVND